MRNRVSLGNSEGKGSGDRVFFFNSGRSNCGMGNNPPRSLFLYDRKRKKGAILQSAIYSSTPGPVRP
jgi:hypothetical protein